MTGPARGTSWAPGAPGVLELPGGRSVRGRSVRRPVPTGAPPTHGLYLTGLRPPATAWPQRWVCWPDFGLPVRFAAAARALTDAYAAAATGRVELGCGGGRGRTGTGLACLAVCAGLPPAQAIAHVRAGYDAHAVETPWQRWYVGWFARRLARRHAGARGTSPKTWRSAMPARGASDAGPGRGAATPGPRARVRR